VALAAPCPGAGLAGGAARLGASPGDGRGFRRLPGVLLRRIRYIGVAAAVLINICSAPLLVALLSGLFLRERVPPVVYSCWGWQ